MHRLSMFMDKSLLMRHRSEEPLLVQAYPINATIRQDAGKLPGDILLIFSLKIAQDGNHAIK